MPYCRACGSEVDGSELACPECGARVWNRAVPQRNDPMAITSLVSGLAGLFACPFVGSIAALVSGTASLRRVHDRPELRGRRLAIAGLATGALGMVWGVVFASIVWTWFQDRPPRQEIMGGPARIQLGADPDAVPQRSLRIALTAAKTIFTDNETYESVTVEALTFSEPSLAFLPDLPSGGPAEVSVHVVSANEIRLAALSPLGTCYAIRDVTGPVGRAPGAGTSYAKVVDGPCRASDVDELLFGPGW